MEWCVDSVIGMTPSTIPLASRCDHVVYVKTPGVWMLLRGACPRSRAHSGVYSLSLLYLSLLPLAAFDSSLLAGANSSVAERRGTPRKSIQCPVVWGQVAGDTRLTPGLVSGQWKVTPRVITTIRSTHRSTTQAPSHTPFRSVSHSACNVDTRPVGVIITATGHRSRRTMATNEGFTLMEKKRPKCKVCGFRIRGKNHDKGSHHQNAKRKQR